jgi:hypothetical protein
MTQDQDGAATMAVAGVPRQVTPLATWLIR